METNTYDDVVIKLCDDDHHPESSKQDCPHPPRPNENNRGCSTLTQERKFDFDGVKLETILKEGDPINKIALSEEMHIDANNDDNLGAFLTDIHNLTHSPTVIPNPNL